MKNSDRTLLAFGRNVARIRADRGFSQDKLAKRADLDPIYISGIERGLRISFATPDSSPHEFQRDSVFQLGAPEGRELVRGPDQGFNRNRVAAMDRLIRVSIPIDSAAEAEAAFV